MLKRLLVALSITSATFAGLSPQAQASRFPAVDLLCYMINSTGEIVDLSPMCSPDSGTFIPQIVQQPIPTFSEALPEETSVPLSFAEAMRAEGYTLMTGNKATQPTISYDVWKRDFDYLYFIWESSPGSGSNNRTNPDVVVQVYGGNATANDNYATGCFFSSGSVCDGSRLSASGLPPDTQNAIRTNLGRMDPHQRLGYSGNCLVPSQTAADGSRCGARAAVIRPGGY